MEAPKRSLVYLILAFLFVAVVVFFLLMPRKEKFINLQSGETTFSLYQKKEYQTPGEVDRAMNILGITLDDKDDLLQMRRCYQIPYHDVRALKKKVASGNLFKHQIEGGMHVRDFDMITCSFRDVQSRIICELQKFYEHNVCNNKSATGCESFPSSMNPASWSPSQKCPFNTTTTASPNVKLSCKGSIQGPVYAFVFQAPYYRNDMNQMMSAQFTIDAFEYLPYNANRAVADSDAPIYYYVQLLFGRYNKSGALSQIDFMKDVFLPRMDNMWFSKEKQCYIITKDNNDQVYLPGGCASTDAPYESRCLGPRNPKRPNADEKTTLSSYGILYEINPNFNLISSFMDATVDGPRPQAPGCGTFDNAKYLRAYPDVKSSGMDPLQHWANKGIREGKLGFIENNEMGGLWHGNGYLQYHTDVARAGVRPLKHLQTSGWKEKRTICLRSPL